MQPPPPSPNSPAGSRWWLVYGALTVGVLMTGGNLAVFPVASEASTVGGIALALWGGVMFGQAGLGAIWLGLARPGALVRLAGAGAAFFVLGGAWLTGFLWSQSLDSEITSMLLGAPILIVTTAAPLWLLRLFLGWHIRQERSSAATMNFGQFSIGSLLLFTTLVAVLLGAAMQACRIQRAQPLQFWGVLGGWCLAIFVLSAATLIPAVLLLSRYRLGFGLLISVTALVYGAVVWFALALIAGFGGEVSEAETAAFCGYIACPFLCFLVTLCLPLVALRQCGYRLVMGGKKKGKE